jgi:hypothetical protein
MNLYLASSQKICITPVIQTLAHDSHTSVYCPNLNCTGPLKFEVRHLPLRKVHNVNIFGKLTSLAARVGRGRQTFHNQECGKVFFNICWDISCKYTSNIITLSYQSENGKNCIVNMPMEYVMRNVSCQVMRIVSKMFSSSLVR